VVVCARPSAAMV